MATADGNIVSEATIARALLRAPIDRVERIANVGRNSRVCRITSGNLHYVLKQYPPRLGDGVERLRCECEALRFLEQNGVGNVPRVVAYDPQTDAVLLTWI